MSPQPTFIRRPWGCLQELFPPSFPLSLLSLSPSWPWLSSQGLTATWHSPGQDGSVFLGVRRSGGEVKRGLDTVPAVYPLQVSVPRFCCSLGTTGSYAIWFVEDEEKGPRRGCGPRRGTSGSCSCCEFRAGWSYSDLPKACFSEKDQTGFGLGSPPVSHRPAPCQGFRSTEPP